MLGETGLCFQGIHDREWMVVDLQGRFLSQRTHPRMASIHPSVGAAALYLAAPGMPVLDLPVSQAATALARPVHIWDDTVEARDCGDAAADWFSTFLGDSCRLVRSCAQANRFANPAWTGGRQVATRFSDGYPLLLIGQASLDDLNRKLAACGRAAVPMDRFRPNLVVDGIGAFEEDYTDVFERGPVQLKPVKPCPRCPIPGIDQISGVAGPNPVDILQTYRANPRLDGGICFGMNTIVGSGIGETLRIGDEFSYHLAF